MECIYYEKLFSQAYNFFLKSWKINNCEYPKILNFFGIFINVDLPTFKTKKNLGLRK